MNESLSGSGNTPDAVVAPGAQLRIVYPPELPISARVDEIRAALRSHAVVIVVGATGSGKTTQLPKVALELSPAEASVGRIGVTQPRRIAATSVAARVASELECGLGADVGYQIRFEDRTQPHTRLKFMTDGILLAEIQSDPLLRQYHTLIIDEAHERSLTIDFLLGYLKRILARRDNLRVIVSSATIEAERFSAFFDGAPVVQVEGRTYPVEVLYEPPDPELDLPEAAANAVASIADLDPRGDILVFLPGEREIAETERELGARKLRHTEVLPLFARLSASEQNRVFNPGHQRRVILATNVAETSLTIPGIVYVVDTGVARLSRYDTRTGTTRLQPEPISRASADQRKGRCGRVRDGICVRLFDEENFQGRPAFTDPEIRRVSLASVILRMKALGLGDIESFAFLDAPNAKSIVEGYRVLEELGALDRGRDLTGVGRKLARLPVDPRVGRMILAGAEQGCLEPILVLAAALEVQDPRERPRGEESKADQAHRRYRDESSDFVAWLKLWSFVQEAAAKGMSNLKRTCRDNYLSFLRVREWREVHRQLTSTVNELRLAKGTSKALVPGDDSARRNVHTALLCGLLSRIGMYQPEQRSYQGSRQTRFVIHPASALAKKPPAWIMTFELVQTTQLFARTVAKIEPEWLDGIANHLLKRSYSEPHWSEKSARASVREHATLYGLPVLRDRSVDFATLSPGRARLIFLEHALVRGEYATRAPFFAKNRALLEEVARLRDKARQSDLLADEEALLTFFAARVPDGVVNGKTFEEWREKAERRTPALLELRMSDVLAGESLVPEHYPDELCVAGSRYQLEYRFDPMAEDDGITVVLPLPSLLTLDVDAFTWTIPAWLEAKVRELIDTLPKPVRRGLDVTEPLLSRLRAELRPFEGALCTQVARSLGAAAGVSLEPAWFRPEALQRYLNFGFRIVHAGKVLASGRDLASLVTEYAPRARELVRQVEVDAKWSRRKVTDWTFGELPEVVTQQVHGVSVPAYPALFDEGDAVAVGLCDSADAAATHTRLGLRRLLQLLCARALSGVAKRLPRPFLLRHGTLPTPSEVSRFRDALLAKVVDVAYLSTAPLPRDRRAFDTLVQAGNARVESATSEVLRGLELAQRELEATRVWIERARPQPGAQQLVADAEQQLDLLFATERVVFGELERLAHYPRYLRALQVRLERGIRDPRKDSQKADPFRPILRAYLALTPEALATPSARALFWAFEELRVSIFAPELKAAFAVTLANLGQAIAALARTPTSR